MAFNVEAFQKWRAEQKQAHEEAMAGGRAVCLHCGNGFTNGVVTADAAICDVCND